MPPALCGNWHGIKMTRNACPHGMNGSIIKHSQKQEEDFQAKQHIPQDTKLNSNKTNDHPARVRA